MKDSTSTPREVHTPIGSTDTAREDAIQAAQPGFFDANGMYSGPIDVSRMEPNEQPYNSQIAQLATHDDTPHVAFAELVDAVLEKDTFKIPDNDTARYQNEKLDGLTTGAPDRFARIAPEKTIAELEVVTAEAERQSNLLKRWSVNIGTVRREFVGAERGSVELPKEYV